MKLTAILLTISVCLLTLQPLASQVYASFHSSSHTAIPSCCKHKQSAKKSHDNGKCCGDETCNPFGACTCCSFLQTKAFTFSTLKIIPQIHQYIAAKSQYFHSSYLSDCFHPPELSV